MQTTAGGEAPAVRSPGSSQVRPLRGLWASALLGGLAASPLLVNEPLLALVLGAVGAAGMVMIRVRCARSARPRAALVIWTTVATIFAPPVVATLLAGIVSGRSEYVVGFGLFILIFAAIPLAGVGLVLGALHLVVQARFGDLPPRATPR